MKTKDVITLMLMKVIILGLVFVYADLLFTNFWIKFVIIMTSAYLFHYSFQTLFKKFERKKPRYSR